MLQNYVLQSKQNNNRYSNRFQEFYSPQGNKKQIIMRQFDTVNSTYVNNPLSEDEQEDLNLLMCFPQLSNQHHSKFQLSLKKKTYHIDEEKKRLIAISSNSLFSTIRKKKSNSCNQTRNNNLERFHHRPMFSLAYNTIEAHSNQNQCLHVRNNTEGVGLHYSMQSPSSLTKNGNDYNEGFEKNTPVLVMTGKNVVELPLIKHNTNENLENNSPLNHIKGSNKHSLRNRLVLKSKNSNPGILKFIK